MTLTNTHNRWLLIGLAFIALCGCRDQEDSMAWTHSQNLPPIDSSRIKRGRVENLDDLMGIDYFRLGTPKKYYRTAYPIDYVYRNCDTCRISNTVMDFHEDCQPTLIFRGDTVAAIRLDMHCRNIRVLIRRLQDLYGEPNDSPFCIQAKPDTTISFGPVAAKSPSPGAYSEEYCDILDSVTTYYGPSLPLYRDNIVHPGYFKEKRWPDTADLRPATSFHFYPDTRIKASWKSNRSLKMTIYREASVRRLPGRDPSEHFLRSDYFVSLLLQ